MKKVLVISTSLRGVSNSHALAEAFAQGAREGGNEVELLTLHHKDIKLLLSDKNWKRHKRIAQSQI